MIRKRGLRKKSCLSAREMRAVVERAAFMVLRESAVELVVGERNYVQRDCNTTPGIGNNYPDNMVARDYYMKLASVQLSVSLTVTAVTGVDQFVRLLVVHGPWPSLITSVLSTSSVYSQYNIEKGPNYTVLYDRTYHLNASGKDGSIVIDKFYVNGLDLNCHFTRNGDLLMCPMIMWIGTIAPGVRASTFSGVWRCLFRNI